MRTDDLVPGYELPSSLHDEEPPAYSPARNSSKDRYSFQSVGHNAMLILPPTNSPVATPLYYITVSLNVLMPLSFITAIYRGEDEFGERIGQFELGMSSIPGHIVYRDELGLVSDFLTKKQGGKFKEYAWRTPQSSVELQWFCSPTMSSCRATLKCSETGAESDELLVQIKLPSPTAIRPYSLLLTPRGHNYFDEIILSFLIIERRRLTPGQSLVHKELWN